MTCDLSTLGGRMRHARLVQDPVPSCRAVSQKAGLAEPLVARIESDPDANPTLSTVRAIARALGVDEAWLFTGAGEAPPLPAADPDSKVA